MSSALERVVEAVRVLNHDPLSCNQVVANQWLLQFQHYPVATPELSTKSSNTRRPLTALFKGQAAEEKGALLFPSTAPGDFSKVRGRTAPVNSSRRLLQRWCLNHPWQEPPRRLLRLALRTCNCTDYCGSTNNCTDKWFVDD